MEDLIGPSEPDEFGLPSKRHESCLGALLWLADEGYLRFDSSIRFEALDQAVLTEKGFLRLSRPVAAALGDAQDLPASILRVRASLARQLREALLGADSERLARLTRLVFETESDATDDIV
ncbi:hypothetical protein D3C84_1042370 [compost metagenome]